MNEATGLAGDAATSIFKEQLRVLLRTASLADAAAAKDELKALVEAAGRPETSKLYRTVCRWWKEIEVLIVTGAATEYSRCWGPSVVCLGADGQSAQ